MNTWDLNKKLQQLAEHGIQVWWIHRMWAKRWTYEDKYDQYLELDENEMEQK